QGEGPGEPVVAGLPLGGERRFVGEVGGVGHDEGVVDVLEYLEAGVGGGLVGVELVGLGADGGDEGGALAATLLAHGYVVSFRAGGRRQGGAGDECQGAARGRAHVGIPYLSRAVACLPPVRPTVPTGHRPAR